MSHNAFLIASFNLAIWEKLKKKMESDSDYEEPSEDPFEGQFSDSDDSDASDDSLSLMHL